MKLFIVFLSTILDILLLNILNFSSYNISYFFPMFTITSIVFISNFYSNKIRKNYYMITLLCSIIYDTLTINNLLITITLFEVTAVFNMWLKNRINNNLFNNIIRLVLSIFVYDSLYVLLLFLGQYKQIDFSLLIYKISHSILLNVIYFSTMFLVLKNKKA